MSTDVGQPSPDQPRSQQGRPAQPAPRQLDFTRASSIAFGGEGRVQTTADAVTLGMGSPLTGVRFDDPALPTVDYELSLRATRVRGGDFFCGLTFPVRDSHCTLVLGGWGGALVGLSCIDDLDASENASTTHLSFDNGRAYAVRVRVTAARLQVHVDEVSVIDVDIANAKISLRGDVAATAPLAVCSYATAARIENLTIRHLAVANIRR